MKRPLTAIMVGAGNRAFTNFGPFALDNPQEMKFIAVVEQNRLRRMKFGQLHKIPDKNQFNDWFNLFKIPKFADFVIIATPDKLHFEPAVLAMKNGYHVLVEKPMADTEERCLELVKISEETGKILQICHELRYTTFYTKLKEVVESKILGEIITVKHEINFPYWAYGHGFVRGNWSNQTKSTPIILAKACHDFDIMYWLIGENFKRICSMSRPPYLKEMNRPKGAPERCTDGCPHSKICQYNAIDMYFHAIHVRREMFFSHNHLYRLFSKMSFKYPRLLKIIFPPARNYIPFRGWPINAITDDLTDEGIMEALRTGPYGRCVYYCDNDQVSIQVSNIEFTSGIMGTLILNCHSYRDSRNTRIEGTEGSLIANFIFGEEAIYFYNPLTGRTTPYNFKTKIEMHGGGDPYLLKGFIRAILGESKPLTDVHESLQSHLMAFAADRSAREKR